MSKNGVIVSIMALALLGAMALSGGTVAAGTMTTSAIQIESGSLVGKVVGGVQVFKGIPYAAPPVGALRWQPPQPAAPWSQKLNAFKDGPICVQPLDVTKPASVGQEDCLTLNIWAPLRPVAPLAVMVFIHGGSYVKGSSDGGLAFFKTYDGTRLALSGPVIVVTLNYRLGPMGFFAHPALFGATPLSRSGNFGLMDQLAALTWVKQNIQAFGGDPQRVTLFGESAGASSVMNLLTSPLAKGLFSRAIVQSGYQKAMPRTEAFGLSANLSQRSGCAETADVATCLRQLTAEKVLANATGSQLEKNKSLFLPNQDSYIIPEPLNDAYAHGHTIDVPVIFGTNADENASLSRALYGPAVKTEAEFKRVLIEAHGEAFFRLASDVYGSMSFDTPQKKLERITTDAIFTCPVSKMAGEFAQKPTAKVWRYVFSHHLSFPLLGDFGSPHASELPFVFGTLPAIVNSKRRQEMSRVMIDYWTNFAKNGDPNGPGEPAWPQYRVGQPSYIDFYEAKGGIKVGQGYRAQECAGLGFTSDEAY